MKHTHTHTHTHTQVEKDARDIAAGEMQAGADASVFPVLSKMARTAESAAASSMPASAATSRAHSAIPSEAIYIIYDIYCHVL